MCRMMLYISKEKDVISKKYTDAFVKIAKDGLSKKCNMGPHGDGYGIVFMKGEEVMLYKSTRPIWESGVPAIPANLILIHARKKSKGSKSIRNIHPFILNDLILAHNGNIHLFNKKPNLYKPHGETDSETLAALLAEEYHFTENVLVAIKNIIDFVESFTALNLIVISLRELKAIVVNLYNVYPVNCNKYYVMWLKKEGDTIIISSEPLDQEDWMPLSTEREKLVIVEIPLYDIRRYTIFS